MQKYTSVIVLYTEEGSYETSCVSGNNARYLHETLQGRAKNYLNSKTCVGLVTRVAVRTSQVQGIYIVSERTSELSITRTRWTHKKLYRRQP